jgi:hypothetical protein
VGVGTEPDASFGDYSGAVTDPAETNTPVTPRCPWCSTEVTTETVTCPTCGATLREEAVADIPGLTQVDPGAASVRPTARGRGLIGWLSGDYETTDTAADLAGVEPPSTAVRQEMLRLEMDALRSELEAEAAARGVEAAEAEPEPEPETQPGPAAADEPNPAEPGEVQAGEDGSDSAS